MLLESIDLFTLFTATIILLSIGIFSSEMCRRDPKIPAKDRAVFTFSGNTPTLSIISYCGSMFSVTYFFGATFIYGNIYGGWLIGVSLVSLAISSLVVLKILQRCHRFLPARTVDSGRSNLLLDLLNERLEKDDFTKLSWIYFGIYLLLLAEEIAVTRLIISNLLPFHPVVTSAFIMIICTTIAIYLHYGGFRAVLASDHGQFYIVALFVIVLAVLIFRDFEFVNLFNIETNYRKSDHALGVLASLVFGVAWFSVSLDTFVRLNFESKRPENLLRERRDVVLLGMISLLVIFTVGIMFGRYMSKVMPTVGSPERYTQIALKYFVHNESRMVVIVFISGIFCMIFTTIDTLFHNLLQIGCYTRRRWPQRSSLFTLLLAGAILSSFIPNNSVSAVGIFIGSLMITVLLGAIHAIFFKNSTVLPSRINYLESSIGMSVIVFAMNYVELRTSFEFHFAIPLIVLGSTVTAIVISRGFELLQEKNK